MAEAKTTSQAALLRTIILVLIGVVAFSSRLFSVIRFESVIHEFDPWFNFRATKQLVENGYYNFLNWFDQTSWYPLGRVVGGTVYPGLMVTAAFIHYVLKQPWALYMEVDIRDICVFLAPLFSAFTAVVAYLLTSEMKDSSAGLLAAIFIGIAPGYISRSVAGSYDNEGIAIFLLLLTFWLWIRALKTGSALYGALTAIFYFYMVSAWGGYVFITNLIPLHAFVLILMGRFSTRLYISYCSFYTLGTLMSMLVPFVGFQPIRTSEHMAALGIFGLLQLIAFAYFVRSYLPENQFKYLLTASIVLIAGVMFAGLVVLTMGGVIAPWTGRFYSLWDTGYAKKYIPIIASVSEHQPTTWSSFFFDLQIMVFLFPAGIYLLFKELRDEHVFVILYGVAASYFAGVMVRLMLTLTPIVCVTAAIAVSTLLDSYLRIDDSAAAPTAAEPAKSSSSSTSSSSSAASASSSPATPSKKGSVSAASGANTKDKDSSSKDVSIEVVQAKKGFIVAQEVQIVVVFLLTLSLFMFAWHCTWVTSNAYSSPSIVLASRNHDGSQNIIDDFREAYYWLRKNTAPDARVMSWWDYGYQIAGMANRTTLVDNNTWNNTHIATVGKAMSTSEEVSYKVMRQHDVDYVLVIFGGVLGYSGDDINKFLWMVRIAEGVYPSEVQERKYFTDRGEYKVDREATSTMINSVMYKASYYRFAELPLAPGQTGYDRVRGYEIGEKNVKLSVMEEAYTTQHWIVRIYKVKDLDNLGRTHKEAALFEERRGQKSSRGGAGGSSGGKRKISGKKSGSARRKSKN